MVLNKLKLVLASKSPRRKELLGYLNIPFEIDSCDIDEISSHDDPKLYCEDIAEQKGRAVFYKRIKESSAKNIFVISSDTIVFLEGKIYGKPKDKDDARKILLELSGKTHTVF
ncbi:MAG: Maf family protein, partial [Bacteriovoracaceae bacterium]|nr:Maf family protein [Bacteriovoracaceae bacterium]